MDTTISGSRNGLTPLMLWYAIHALGNKGMKQRLEGSLATAAYVEQEFKRAGIAAWRNPAALTVIFPQPASAVCNKWQLASANGFSHVVCMPHVKRQQVDELLQDILAPGGEIS
jgi:histidine decarboxylase